MSGSGINAPSTDWREPIGQHQMARPVRRMVSAAMLLTALLAACLVLDASGLSAAAQAASTSASECIAGTGAPLPPAVEAASTAGCHGYTAPTPTNAPTPLALEPGALPVVQALPGASAVDLSAGLAPLAQTPGSRESFYWYSLFATKTEPQENCWQTGVLGASSYACDSVGASYLPNGPHMHEVSEQGVGEDFQISPSGDYCNYYRIGEGLDTTNANKQSGNTGYEPPSPLSSYQEGDKYSSPNVCQAYETFWGQVLQGSGNSKCETRPPCGMQHYVSLHEQGGNDRPWGSSFGEPSLVISDDVLPYSLGTHGGAWGYLCPLFEDQTTGDILESCLEEWRVGSGYPSTNEHFDVVSACASGGSPAHNIDQTITQFASGTSFAENVGSEKTFVFGSNSSWRDFSARITRAGLENAVNADRRNHPFSKKETEEAEKGERSWSEQGCGRSLSTNPANYALIGIEQGVEGGGLSEIGASDANLQLWTEYTPLPPEATTNAASGVQPTQATLNGTVNPKGTDTHYYFRYGKTTAYGSSTSSTDAGSGMSSVPASTVVTSLESDTLYHYRLVATSGGGTVEGEDRTFMTPGPPTVTTEPVAGVTETGAVLHGSINPHEAETHYYFQYGTTTSYGSSTHEEGAGSGKESVSGSATITGLEPGVLYHYRLVATNAWGTSYGSDGRFATPNEVSSRWAVRDPVTGDQWVYFVNGRGTVSYWESTPSGTTYHMLGGKPIASGTLPTVIRNVNTGDQCVFYQGTDGAIWYWLWTPGNGWVNKSLGGHAAAKTNPTAEYKSDGQTLVYYVNSSNNHVWYFLNYSEEKWSNGELEGGEVAANTSPTAEYKPNGESLVYYINRSDSSLWYLQNTIAGAWEKHKLGGDAAPNSSPVAEYKPDGQSLVYFVNNSDKSIWYFLNYSEEKWSGGTLGSEDHAAANTSPTVDYKPHGETLISYVNSESTLSYWLNTTQGDWYNGGLGGHVAANTSPIALAEAGTNGEQWVFYVNSSDNTVLYWHNIGESWYGTSFGGRVAANTTPSVEYKPSGESLVYYVNSSDNSIRYWLNVGEEWFSGPLGGEVAANSSPVAEYKTNGQSLVYYVNRSNNSVWYFLNYSEGEWSKGELGGEVAANTSPSVEYKPNGETLVYYVNRSDNSIWYLQNTLAGAWEKHKLGGEAAAGSSPVAEYKADGQSLVYYVNHENNSIWYFLNYSEEKWSKGELGGEVAGDTSPSVEYKPNGETLLDYVNRSDSSIWYLQNTLAGAWEKHKLGGEAAAGSSPVAEYKADGQSLVYYVNHENNSIWYFLNYSEEKWSDGSLGNEAHAATNTSPIVEYKPNGETLVYYVDGTENTVWYWLNTTQGSWYNGTL
jgi:hypothetical protein